MPIIVCFQLEQRKTTKIHLVGSIRICRLKIMVKITNEANGECECDEHLQIGGIVMTHD